MQVANPKARATPQPSSGVRTVTVLGATGSVGMSTVDLLKRGNGKYRVEAVTAHKNAKQLAQIARELNARFAVVADPSAYEELKDALSGSGIQAAGGAAAVIEAAERPADWVMAAVSGSVGLRPTLAAAKRGATVALANKECLVCAGAMFMRNVALSGATVLPVDSEHNAIFQALTAGPREDVSRIVITASGGPFRTWTRDAMRAATVEQALKHPNWSMSWNWSRHTTCSRSCRTSSPCSSTRNRSFMEWSNTETAPLWRNLARPTCALQSRIAWRGRPASMDPQRGSISQKSVR